MQVEQIMSRPVQCCRPDDSLARAAEFMWHHDCGALPVVSGDGVTRIVGMLTDRDICMSALFQNKPIGELRVSNAMAKNVHTCRETDSIAAAEQIMRESRVRRLPVVDAEGTLVGLVSLADLAQEAARERSTNRREVSRTEIGDTLAAICEPPGRQLAA
jgi:CBS domain-containing protein